MKSLILFISFICVFSSIYSQVGINNNGSAPDPSAILDVKSSSQGMLPPRMLASERVAISNPASGLIVYQTDGNKGLYVNIGSSTSPDWKFMGEAPDLESVLASGNSAAGIPINNLPSPTIPAQAANKGYVDSLVYDCETRIPIDTLPYIISSPGSYYVTKDLSMAHATYGSGINIYAGNVTLDLNGYTLTGGPSTYDGIKTSEGNVIIMNGRLRNWGWDGIDIILSDSSVLQNLSATHNGRDGIQAGSSSIISGCITSSNGENGIIADDASIISNCTSMGNQEDGINTGEGCVIYNCTSSENGEAGFRVDDGSIIYQCSAYRNQSSGMVVHDAQILHCVASSNSECGFYAFGGSICQCLANNNGGGVTTSPPSSDYISKQAGIRAGNDTYVYNNTSHNNKGAGIYTSGTDIVIEANVVTDNDNFGIINNYSSNLIIMNRASGNTHNTTETGLPVGTTLTNQFRFSSNTSYGPLIDVSSGGDISLISNSNHPQANIAY